MYDNSGAIDAVRVWEVDFTTAKWKTNSIAGSTLYHKTKEEIRKLNTWNLNDIIWAWGNLKYR
jgi:hypothetical protein